MSDVLLTVLPGHDPNKRVAVMMHREKQESTIQLCQQTFSEAVGWFTQSSVELTPEQLSGLKNSLGGMPRSARNRRGDAPAARTILAFPA